jgi:hypothetical protein
MRLRLVVDGIRVAETSHRSSREALAGVDVFAFSARGGTDVRFDNLIVRDRTGG